MALHYATCYCIVVYGIARCYMLLVLYNIVLYSMVLHGIAWYCHTSYLLRTLHRGQCPWRIFCNMCRNFDVKKFEMYRVKDNMIHTVLPWYGWYLCCFVAKYVQ